MSGDWQDLAECRGMDPRLFVFQEPRSGVRDRKVIKAKAVCATCPVRAECLDDALGWESIGVFGGTTEDERRRMRRQRRRTNNLPFGEANKTSKLTAVQVAEIRASGDTQIVLAERYGMSQTAISRIKRNIYWQSVA